MKKWLLFLISPILYVVSLLSVHLSGNDKAPFLVFLAFGVIVIIFIISGINNLIKGWISPNSNSLFWGATLTIIYVIAIILLSRAGLVNSSILLGFQ